MKFAIDLTTVTELKPLPAGTFVMKIEEIDGTKTAKSSGKPKLQIKNKVVAPTQAAKEVPTWYLNLSLSEGALFRVKQLFEACLVPIKPTGFDTADLIGREYGVALTLEEYVEEGKPRTGRMTNQIVSFFPAKSTKPELAPVASATAPAAAPAAAPKA